MFGSIISKILMTNSLKGKIIIPVAAILLALVAIIIVYVLFSVGNLTDELTDIRIEGALRSLETILENREERAKIIARSLAGDYTVLSNLNVWNMGKHRVQCRINLINHLNEVSQELGVDSFVIRDFEGRVVLRLHDLEHFDDIDGSPASQAAFLGETTTSYTSTEAMPMGLNATTPIWYEDEIIGTMTPIFFLHTEEFVDNYSETLGAQVTVFAGKTRVATTVTTETGERAVGTDLTNETIIKTVLEQGENFKGEAILFGKPHQAYYIPLKNLVGDSVGMLFVGFSNEFTDNATSSMLNTTVIIGILGLIIAVLILLSIAGRISKPITELTEFFNTLASTGKIELDPETKVIFNQYNKRKDEIGQLYADCSDVMDSLMAISNEMETIANGDLSIDVNVLSQHDRIGMSMQKMVENLSNMFGEINVATTQVASGSKQIADGAQTLAQGSTQQASATQQLSGSIQEIAQKTKENAEMADKAAQLANTIMQSAEKGNTQMGEMMAAVKDIDQASHSIGKVIKVIDDIAFQTNILALNAAVEAARAGQHGKGFAVVAEEVRNLAAKSSEAAKDTGGLIANSIQKAELGSRIAGETASSLADIVSGIGESAVIVNEIARSSDEQSSGIEEINKGIDQVSQVVQQNAATAQESAAASQEMSSQSALLESLISQFKLKEGTAGARGLKSANGSPQMQLPGR